VLRNTRFSSTFIFVLVFCGGCFGPAPAAEYVRQAQRLHDGALASAVTSDADLRDYVQLVGQRLVEAAKAAEPGKVHDPVLSQMQFHLVGCAVPNVFTTGGSHLYVHSAVFQLARTEDELAAAIAHAYAHAMNLDIEHVGMRPDPARPLPGVAWDFVVNRLKLPQEQEADRLAFEVYTKAGYDPSRFAALFENLAQVAAPQAPDRIPPAARAKAAQSWAGEAPKVRRPLPVADPRTFATLRSGAARLSPTGSPDAQLILRAFPNCLLAGDTPDQQSAQQQLRPPPPPPTRLEPS
jgi:predicted Zn-dependent protease